MLNEKVLELNVAISRKKSWVSMHFWLKLDLQHFDEKTEKNQKPVNWQYEACKKRVGRNMNYKMAAMAVMQGLAAMAEKFLSQTGLDHLFTGPEL